MTGNRATNDRWYTFQWRGDETEQRNIGVCISGKFEVDNRLRSSFAIVSSIGTAEQLPGISGMHPMLSLARRSYKET